ncbi:MAG: plasmid pRiA4b ORF-3 family protein [Thermovirgaceae bacterium]|jgi:hypothetical protein|nr:plasmid pRiA4b ORF-3 family protein [Thermovirga sp.]
MEGNAQIYIELEGIIPKIWRRIVVPSFITLDRLSDVIQIVMGWSGEHMHIFSIKGRQYMDLPEDNPEAREEGLFRLGSLVSSKGSPFTYTYDLGDNWTHLVKVEKMGMEDDDEWGNLFCVDGGGACPPDDSGGVPGFLEFRRSMADKKDPQHEFFLEWYGEEFDPDNFDPGEANITLLYYILWSRERLLPWTED